MEVFIYQTLLLNSKLHTSPLWQPLGGILLTGYNVAGSMSARHSLQYLPKRRNSPLIILQLSTFLSHHLAQLAHPTTQATNFPSTLHSWEKYAHYKAGLPMPSMKSTHTNSGSNSRPLSKPGSSPVAASVMASVGVRQPSKLVFILTTGNFRHAALFASVTL